MALSYPAAIVHNLIQNKLVSSAMVEQGLLPILQLGHDWVRRSTPTCHLIRADLP